MPPTKWISYYHHSWYFEKQKNNSTSWLEYNRKKLDGNYTQIWSGTDAYGDPVVVIASLSEPLVIDLTEGKYFWRQSLDAKYDPRFVAGFWGQQPKRDGFISLSLSHPLQFSIIYSI